MKHKSPPSPENQDFAEWHRDVWMQWDEELVSPRGAGGWDCRARCGSVLAAPAECPWHRRWFGCREHECCADTALPLRCCSGGWQTRARCTVWSRPERCPAPPSWCQVLCGSRCGRTGAALGLLKQRKESPVCPGQLVTRGSCCQALWELLRGVGYNQSLSEQHSYCWCNSIHIYLYIHIYICICISII